MLSVPYSNKVPYVVVSGENRASGDLGKSVNWVWHIGPLGAAALDDVGAAALGSLPAAQPGSHPEELHVRARHASLGKVIITLAP